VGNAHYTASTKVTHNLPPRSVDLPERTYLIQGRRGDTPLYLPFLMPTGVYTPVPVRLSRIHYTNLTTMVRRITGQSHHPLRARFSPSVRH
jgi:hypothetical protein